MRIIQAEERHIPQLLELLLQVELVHHAIRPDIFKNGAQKYEAQELKAILEDPLRPVYAAVEGDRVLGYCFCMEKAHGGGGVMHPRREFYIDDLCVRESAQRQGVAHALFQYAVEQGKARSCGSVTLNVWCGNQGALAFYTKEGLTPRNITMEYPLEES